MSAQRCGCICVPAPVRTPVTWSPLLLRICRRHRALPLVSQRCRSLLCSPQLLHSISFWVPDNSVQPMRYVRSMARFLMRCAAGRVQQLSLELGDTGEADPQERQECMALLSASALWAPAAAWSS